MIEVKDNFLTDDEFKTVTEILHPKFVPWSFQQKQRPPQNWAASNSPKKKQSAALILC